MAAFAIGKGRALVRMDGMVWIAQYPSVHSTMELHVLVGAFAWLIPMVSKVAQNAYAERTLVVSTAAEVTSNVLWLGKSSFDEKPSQ